MLFDLSEDIYLSGIIRIYCNKTEKKPAFSLHISG
jgi:hypothetical protein